MLSRNNPCNEEKIECLPDTFLELGCTRLNGYRTDVLLSNTKRCDFESKYALLPIVLTMDHMIG